jgi:hypothetical protein
MHHPRGSENLLPHKQLTSLNAQMSIMIAIAGVRLLVVPIVFMLNKLTSSTYSMFRKMTVIREVVVIRCNGWKCTSEHRMSKQLCESVQISRFTFVQHNDFGLLYLHFCLLSLDKATLCGAKWDGIIQPRSAPPKINKKLGPDLNRSVLNALHVNLP